MSNVIRRRRPPRADRVGRGRPTIALVVAVLVASITVVSLARPSGTVEAAPIAVGVDAAGPLGGVSIIGDSVLMGAALYGPTLPDHLASRGWGPIRFRAGEGYTTGIHGVNEAFEASYWIGRWKAEGWDPDHVIVNLGANDSGFCEVDLACARSAILHVVDAIGPGKTIWWPQITRFPLPPFSDQQDNWNLALTQIAGERDDFHTWDWPTEMATGPYPSNDGTHLSPDGYRRRSARMAEVFTGEFAVAERIGSDAALPPTIGGTSELVALAPERVYDSRRDAPGPVGGGDTVTIDLSAHVPSGATAVAVGLTATQTSEAGFVSARPCDRAPRDVSSLNYPAGRDRGAMAVLPLAADGTLCVTTSATSHLIVDLQGAFVPGGTESSRFDTVDPPRRLADTRVSGRTTLLTVPVPASADAVAVNLTADGASAPGFLTAHPCGGNVPEVSNVNFGPAEPVAGSAFVPVGTGGSICVFASTDVDVIVDITGTFSDDGELGFVPVLPTRMLDTRSGTGGWTPIHGADQTLDVRVVPDGVAAVTGTITLVEPITGAFLIGHGCGVQPDTSSVNALGGMVMANALTVGVSSSGRLCVAASAVTHTLFDVTGWWVDVA